jgi:hypothetical protein
LRLLVRCYVDVTGGLVGASLISAQRFARGVRGDGDERFELQAGSKLKPSPTLRWTEIVAEREGRIIDGLREQLRLSALSTDEREKIEAQANDDSTREPSLACALEAHVRFVAAAVERETSAARRKLRDALFDVCLDVVPRYIVSRRRNGDDVEAKPGRGALAFGRVCHGAETANGLRSACTVKDGLVPAATALCSYCGNPKMS